MEGVRTAPVIAQLMMTFGMVCVAADGANESDCVRRVAACIACLLACCQ